MSEKDQIFLAKRSKYNRRIVAQYLALYTENSHLKKCMITLTPKDGLISTTLKMRKDFFKKLNRYKKNKKDGDTTIKYFSNVEFNEHYQSHLHIQIFYTSLKPIKKAFDSMINFINDNTNANTIEIAKNHKLIFNYVIKDYRNTNLALERLKATKTIQYITSSRKAITNKIIRYLFRTLDFKSKNGYNEILELIEQKKIEIIKGFVRNKPKNSIFEKIDLYTVIVHQ